MRYAVFNVLRNRKVWILSFWIGLSAGMIYANIKWFNCTEEINSYITYWSDRISNSDINKSDFQKYIFGYRLKELLMIFIFNLTIAGRFFNCCYLGYLGYSAALMESVLTLKYGYRGIGLYTASIFPHYIVYVIVLLYTLSKCEVINKVFFNDRKRFSGNSIGINEVKSIVVNVLFIVFLAWFESFLESYINIHIFV